MGLCSAFPFCQGSFETTISWGQEKRRVVSACLISRMKQLQSGDLVSLWIEARREASGRVFNKTGSSLTQWNVRHVTPYFRAEKADMQMLCGHCGPRVVHSLTIRRPSKKSIIDICTTHLPPGLTLFLHLFVSLQFQF